MRKENESLIKFAKRLFSLKDSGADLDNTEMYLLLTGKTVSSDEARKRIYGLRDFLEKVETEGVDSIEDEDIIQTLEERKAELYKQQVKTGDLVREYRNTLRNEARIEEIKSGLYQAIRTLSKFEVVAQPKYSGNDKVAVLTLSDFHYGADVDNFYNKFNPEILKQRVNTLLGETVKYCEKFGIKKLHVINAGDMLEGSLHVQSRIFATEDAISQVINVAELISNSLYVLSQSIPNVVYHSCSDNHSRVQADKKMHIEAESFGRIIDWFIKERVKNTNIEFHDNVIDYSIGYFEELGKKFMFVHGHLDSPGTVIQNLSLGIGIIPDYVIMGHYHHKTSKDIQSKTLIMNGTLKGVDDYCMSRRLFNKPSQTMLILDGDNELIFNIMV